MANIILRPARYSELTRIAHISARAFWDDNLFGDLIHPHRKAYPADMALWWLRRARVNFWDWTWHWMVAVEVRKPQVGAPGKEGSETQQEEVVVGAAQWVREGQGGKKMQCAWYDPRRCIPDPMDVCLCQPGSEFDIQHRLLVETPLLGGHESARPPLAQPGRRPGQ